MKHIDEEQFILYHYGEPIDRAAIEGHLAVCERCRSDKATLDLVFQAVDRSPVPERAEDYGVEVWQRLRPQLRRDGRPLARNGWARAFGWQRWALGGAVAAAIAAAFLVGRLWPRPEAPTELAISAQARDRILLSAIADHVERAEILLMSLDNTRVAPGERVIDISSEQQRAEELVAGNRIYEETAEREGETGLASLLDDLGRVLLEVGHSPDTVSSAELDELRTRVEGQGLLFKIQVVDSRLQQRIREQIRRTEPNAM